MSLYTTLLDRWKLPRKTREYLTTEIMLEADKQLFSLPDAEEVEVLDDCRIHIRNKKGATIFDVNPFDVFVEQFEYYDSLPSNWREALNLTGKNRFVFYTKNGCVFSAHTLDKEVARKSGIETTIAVNVDRKIAISFTDLKNGKYQVAATCSANWLPPFAIQAEGTAVNLFKTTNAPKFTDAVEWACDHLEMQFALKSVHINDFEDMPTDAPVLSDNIDDKLASVDSQLRMSQDIADLTALVTSVAINRDCTVAKSLREILNQAKATVSSLSRPELKYVMSTARRQLKYEKSIKVHGENDLDKTKLSTKTVKQIVSSTGKFAITVGKQEDLLKSLTPTRVLLK
jgi:hypothetical protein